MSDLISRKALIKEFWEFTNGGKQRYLIPEEIWEMVELEPTAYDPDKVVEQLEEKSNNEIELWATEEINYDSKGDLIIRRTTDLHDYGMRCYQNAIEIVERGGIDET